MSKCYAVVKCFFWDLQEISVVLFKGKFDDLDDQLSRDAAAALPMPKRPLARPLA